MTTAFTEISPQEVQRNFPRFYAPQGRFFEIVYKKKEIGFLGLRPLSAEECELEVYVFPQYRNALTKGLVFSVLDFPKSLGFRRGIMTTIHPKLLRLLHFFVKGAKLETELRDQKQIFMRKYS